MRKYVHFKRNNWYKAATKIAIAVDDGDTSALSAFTGTNETVLKVNSGREDLKTLLCRLAVVSSTMQSRSISAGAANNGDEDAALDMAKEAIKQTTESTDNDTSGFGTAEAPDNNPWGAGW